MTTGRINQVTLVKKKKKTIEERPKKSPAILLSPISFFVTKQPLELTKKNC